MSAGLRKAGLFLAGAAAAALLATVLVKDQLHRQRRNLFSPNVFRRMAALRHLAGEPATVDAVNLARDFAAWEPRRLLRRTAWAVAERMEEEVRRRAGSA